MTRILTAVLTVTVVTGLALSRSTAPIEAQATHQILHSFHDIQRDPDRVVQTADGRIFGTHVTGGPGGYGTVYMLEPDGLGGYDETILVAFDQANGAYPYGGLIDGGDGSLYGTTYQGGSTNLGTLYRIDSDGTHTILSTFASSGGYRSRGGLSLGSDGYLYGTTINGGAHGRGTVFRATHTGSVTHVASFTTAAWQPYSAPLLASDGNLYVATISSSAGYGAIVKVDSSGLLSVPYTFSGGADGAHPYGGMVQGSDGLLYGTAYTSATGGIYGAVYRMTLAGSLTVVKQFTSATYSTHGAHPYGGLVAAADGHLYGTTLSGGTYNRGTAFRLSTAGTFASLHSFVPNEAWHPRTALSQGADGDIYGTLDQSDTAIGGLFRIGSSGAVSHIHVFNRDDSGRYPYGGLIEVAPDEFLVSAYQGGSADRGALVSVRTDGTVTTKLSFTGTTGHYPIGSLLLAGDGNVYGTTRSGGTSGIGTVFRFAPDGTHTVLRSFSYPIDGGLPWAGLAEGSDGNFYGVNEHYGSGGRGTIFRITPGGTMAVLHQMSVADGQSESTLVKAADGLFYGTTINGGPSGLGTIYSVSESGVFTTVHAFSGPDGDYPRAGLATASDGNLYGVTYRGGSSGVGTVFRLTPGVGITTIRHLTTAFPSVRNPMAALVQASDGYLYGTTLSGGSWGRGGVFRIDLSGNLETVYSFQVTDGYQVYAPLVQGSDGRLYGATLNGGPGQRGTVFALTIPSAVTLSNLNHVYDGTAKAAVATTNPPGLSVDITYSQGGSPVAAPTNAGSYQVTAVIDDATYSGTAIGTLVISPATAVVSLTNLSHTFDGTTKAATASTNPGGLTVHLDYRQGGVPVTPFNAGNYDVEATVDDPNYLGSTSGTLEIAKAAATLGLGPLSFVYDGSPKPVSVTTTPGGLTGVSVTYDGSPTAPSMSGTYPVVASLVHQNYEAEDAVGELVIASATPTLTWAPPSAITYGTPLSGTQLNASADVSGTFTYAPAAGAVLDAGANQVLEVEFVPDDPANYETSSASVLIDVLPASLTVTANHQEKTYGEADPTLTFVATGFQAGDAEAGVLSGALARVAAEAVGDYAIQQGSLVANGNYTISFVGNHLTISPKAASVTPDAAGKTYGETEPALTGTLAGFLAADGVTATYARVAGETVAGGPYAITATLGPAGVLGNYDVTYHTADFTIAAAGLTVTASGGTKTYGETFDVEPTFSGFAAGEDVSVLSAPAVCTSDGEPAGAGVLDSPFATSCSGATAENYAIGYVDGTLTVLPAPLTVTADDKTVVFTGSPVAGFTAGYSGFVAGDGPGDLGGALTFTGPATTAVNAGQHAIVPTGLTSSDYALTFQPGTLTIEKAAQTIVVTTPAPSSSAFGASFTVGATGGGSGQPVAFSASGGCTNSGAAFTMTSGLVACTVRYNQAGDQNHQAAEEVLETVDAIAFGFEGFKAPLSMSGGTVTVWNTVKAGASIPVKWRLTLEGAPVSSLASFAGLWSYAVGCSSGAGDVEDAIDELAPGSSGLQYNGDGNFQYNWKTPKSYPAGSCRAMYVAFADGTMSPVAFIKFR